MFHLDLQDFCRLAGVFIISLVATGLITHVRLCQIALSSDSAPHKNPSRGNFFPMKHSRRECVGVFTLRVHRSWWAYR